MRDTLVSALSTLSSLQRWNFLPRVETWVESENIAYMAHMGYAIAKTSLGFNEEQISILLTRILLKSFNKHYLSDIPVHSREILKNLDDGKIWEELVKEAAHKTSKLFPRSKKVSLNYYKYLSHNGEYYQDITLKEKIEELVKYLQYKTAYEECSINSQIYKNYYEEIIKEIENKINKLNSRETFEEGYKILENYFYIIKKLKYIRRWNRINRLIESSVLTHTFIVSFLVMFFSDLSENEIKENNEEKNFRLKAILKAMFHDVPESLSGDLISPVKQALEKISPNAWKKVEKDLIEKQIIKKASEAIKQDFDTYKLLDELNDKDPYSIDSLVKYCDKLALVIECVFEKNRGMMADEMTIAFHNYINDLQNSEWRYIREFTRRIAVEFPM